MVEDVKLQFARQLYQHCLERRGAEHEQTRKLRDYVADLEKHVSAFTNAASPRETDCRREYTAAP